ncbi:MAG: dTDP-glucose 4,6-dehydratase [Candidatus Marinimicrobia bacterium]|nr:dTDP-glucose 4,6-dehydratase [Candidatus Neomarinimicrobiota bacterium]
MKKIIVTGGCGFIGSNLVKKLLLTKSSIILNIDALKKQSVPDSLNKVIKNKKNYFFKKIDISNFNKLNKLIRDFEPSLIFHLAAESHVDRSIVNPFSFISSNILGTLNIIESIRLNNFWRNNKSFKLIYVSTDEVYGSLKKNQKSFTELNKFYPNSPYSASKASGDLLARAWNKTFNIPIITTNSSNNYGPWQFPEKLIPVVISNCLKGINIPVYGNGTNVRDWLYVEDHIEALIKISKFAKAGSNFNIGGGKEVTNISVVKKICSILDEIEPKKFKYSKLIEFVNDRPGHDFRYSINFNKLKKELNYKPKVEFELGLLKTINWYLSNKKWLLKNNK